MSSTTQQVRQLRAGLDELDHDALLDLLATAEPLATGIGGSTSRLRLNDSEVFVKRIPVSGREAEQPTSTANLFGLPAVCHYGIGSPGFGVGRELATHRLTTRWVEDGVTDHFAIMYHWRVIDQRCPVDLSEFDGPAAARRWGRHQEAVLRRVEALRTAERSVIIFAEYLPDALESWLRMRFAAGRTAAGAAFAEVMAQIARVAAWMWRRGLVHCDVHPGNIRVRDGRLVLTDFGLSAHQEFDLDAGERRFVADHGHYDHDSGIASLVHWVLAELGCGTGTERTQILREAAADRSTARLDPVRDHLGAAAAELVADHAAGVVAFTERFETLTRDVGAERAYG